MDNLQSLFNVPSPLEKIHWENNYGYSVWVKRDDLIHPEVSGNKWRKLHHNVRHVTENGYKGILTFGGAFSNHLLATAFVCTALNLKSIGIVRGEELQSTEKNNLLVQCEKYGMQLIYWTREEYRAKATPSIQSELQEKHSTFWLVPEGGANKQGIRGCEDIVNEIEIEFDYITVDAGTGATAAGMLTALQPHQALIGVQVLKAKDFITPYVEQSLGKSKVNQLKVLTDYHFGGFAKYSLELVEFMRKFYDTTGIKTDPIYTAKQFYAVAELMKKGEFKEGAKIILTHTGGMEGLEGFEKRYKLKVY